LFFLWREITAINMKHNLSLLVVLFTISMLNLGFTTKEATIDRPWQVKLYIKNYGYLAKELSQQTKIPAPLILAVAGLESGWGRSELAKSANNHFGIKAKKEWRGMSYCKNTLEYGNYYPDQPYMAQQCFRKYFYIRESYQDFGSYIQSKHYYRQLLYYPSWNYRAWAEGMQRNGYATDPEYAKKVLSMIWRYQLDQI